MEKTLTPVNLLGKKHDSLKKKVKKFKRIKIFKKIKRNKMNWALLMAPHNSSKYLINNNSTPFCFDYDIDSCANYFLALDEISEDDFQDNAKVPIKNNKTHGIFLNRNISNSSTHE